MIVETTDLFYPLLADVYYPIIEQGPYGNIKKSWVLDKTIACAFNPAGRKFKQDIQPDPNITIDNTLVGRSRTDITATHRDNLNSVTNILITNIRDRNGQLVYNESAGPRAGLGTIFELSTFNPIVGAFGKTEYYKLVIARSDNQGVDI